MNSSAHLPGRWEDQCHQAVLLPTPWHCEVSFWAVRGVQSESPCAHVVGGGSTSILWVSTWHGGPAEPGSGTALLSHLSSLRTRNYLCPAGLKYRGCPGTLDGKGQDIPFLGHAWLLLGFWPQFMEHKGEDRSRHPPCPAPGLESG